MNSYMEKLKNILKKNKQSHNSKTISDLATEHTEHRRLKEAENIDRKRRQKENAPREEEYQRVTMLKTAFVPYWISRFRIVISFILVMALFVPIFIKYKIVNTGMVLLLTFGSIVLGVGMALLLTWLLQTYFIYRDRRWLDRFPYRWDREVYIDILSQPYHKVNLILHIKLDSHISSDWQKTIADAVYALMENTQVQWKDDKLIEIVSPQFKTYKYHHGSLINPYESYNRHLHVWFRKFVEGVFPVFHQEFPINHLEFFIKNL